MADLAARHLPAVRQPHLAPGFLGVGWSRGDEVTLSRGQRCPKCGRVGGQPAEAIPPGFFCLGCLGMRPEDEDRAARCGTQSSAPGREDRAPRARLTKEERRVVGSNLHGRIFLAAIDAEHEGDRARASSLRLLLALYKDRTIDAEELGRRAEEEGL